MGALVARGGESVFRGSLFRTGYELFYTPIPSDEKRAAKSIIDVGFDRLGDARRRRPHQPADPAAAGAASTTRILGARRRHVRWLALIVAARLNRGYIDTLERSLINRAVELDLADVEDITTRTAMLSTLQPSQLVDADARARPPSRPSGSHSPGAGGSGDPAASSRCARAIATACCAVLRDEEGLPAALVPHVIPLLAWDPVAEDAVARAAQGRRRARRRAHRRAHRPQPAVCRPPPAGARASRSCVSQRAADGLMLGLDDLRFEVRFQCGRSLAGDSREELARPHRRASASSTWSVARSPSAARSGRATGCSTASADDEIGRSSTSS